MMTVLLIASIIALTLGISLIVRRGNVAGLAILRGTHLARPLSRTIRPAAEPGELTAVGRTPPRSDRRMLTPSRRRP